MSFVGKTVFVTGASRGIGKSVACAFGREKANVLCFSITDPIKSNLKDSDSDVADEVTKLGGKGLRFHGDVSKVEDVKAGIEAAVKYFGGIDILINNVSVLHLKPTMETPIEKFDWMHKINYRGSFICFQQAYPYLLKSKNPHAIIMCPPIDLTPPWLSDHLAYTITKFSMSMSVLGLSHEFRQQGIAVNGIWPKTCIFTDGFIGALGEKAGRYCRKPEIIADSMVKIASKDSRSFTGNLLVDEEFLISCGVTDLGKYANEPGQTEFIPDLFLKSDKTLQQFLDEKSIS